MNQILFRWVVVVLLTPIWVIWAFALFCFPCCVMVFLSPWMAIVKTVSYWAGGIEKDEYVREMNDCFFLFISPIWLAISTPAEFIKTGKFNL